MRPVSARPMTGFSKADRHRSMRPECVTHGAVGPCPISLPISSYYRLLVQANGLHSQIRVCGIIPALLKYK
jgi:hypothetical protein